MKSEKLEIMLTLRALVRAGRGESKFAKELRKQLAELKLHTKTKSMKTPTQNQTIQFERVPIGSYAIVGIPYLVERVTPRHVYIRSITYTNSATMDTRVSYRGAEWTTL